MGIMKNVFEFQMYQKIKKQAEDNQLLNDMRAHFDMGNDDIFEALPAKI